MAKMLAGGEDNLNRGKTTSINPTKISWYLIILKGFVFPP